MPRTVKSITTPSLFFTVAITAVAVAASSTGSTLQADAMYYLMLLLQGHEEKGKQGQLGSVFNVSKKPHQLQTAQA